MKLELLLDKKDEVRKLQTKQDKIFKQIMSNIPKKKLKEFPGLEHELEDFMYNNIYNPIKDQRKFISDLIFNEIVVEDDEEL